MYSKVIGVLLTSFFLNTHMAAQFNDAGVLVGSAAYKGDLASSLEPTEMNTNFGLAVRRHFSRNLAGRIMLTRGVLTGTDKNAKTLALSQRNLSFRTEYVELNVAAEWHISKLDILAGKNSTPFITAGVGGMYFNPQATLRGMYYDLQPLGTEGQGLAGQRKKYSKFALQTPVGIGFKWALSKRVIFQMQALAHLTYTDYLDDVSGKYADQTILRENNPLAAQLAFRTPELVPSMVQNNPVGLERGNGRPFDRFVSFQAGVSMVLSDKYAMEWDDTFRIYDEPKPAHVKRKKKASFKLFKRKKVIKGVF
jgi:Domain of unknown function (DUF6089)